METSATPQAITPMKLGDIFDKSIKLLGKTWKRSIIISALMLLPAGIVAGLAMQNIFSHFADLPIPTHGGSQAEARAFVESMLRMFADGVPLLLLTVVVSMVGQTLALISNTLIAARQFAGGVHLQWQDALRDGLPRLLPAIGQRILESMALAGILIIPYTLIILGAAALNSPAVAVIGILLMLFGGVPLLVYLMIRWIFTQTVIAYEGSGAMESFRRSSYLVKGSWWRTFGILALLSMCMYFAVSIVTTPIQFIAMADFWKEYFTLISSIGSRAGSSAPPDVSGLFRSMGSMGLGLGIASAVSSMLYYIFIPVYLTIVYFDLRARRNEFAVAEIGAATDVDQTRL